MDKRGRGRGVGRGRGRGDISDDYDATPPAPLRERLMTRSMKDKQIPIRDEEAELERAMEESRITAEADERKRKERENAMLHELRCAAATASLRKDLKLDGDGGSGGISFLQLEPVLSEDETEDENEDVGQDGNKSQRRFVSSGVTLGAPSKPTRSQRRDKADEEPSTRKIFKEEPEVSMAGGDYRLLSEVSVETTWSGIASKNVPPSGLRKIENVDIGSELDLDSEDGMVALVGTATISKPFSTIEKSDYSAIGDAATSKKNTRISVWTLLEEPIPTNRPSIVVPAPELTKEFRCLLPHDFAVDETTGRQRTVSEQAQAFSDYLGEQNRKLNEANMARAKFEPRPRSPTRYVTYREGEILGSKRRDLTDGSPLCQWLDERGPVDEQERQWWRDQRQLLKNEEKKEEGKGDKKGK